VVTREQLRNLAAFDAHGACVLSAYLRLTPDRQVKGTYRTAFKDLVKDTRPHLVDERERAQFDSEVERISTFLAEEPPRGQSLAMFSSRPAGLWQPRWFNVPIRDRLVWDRAAYVEPLVDLLDEYEPYEVALVDKEHARFFSIFLGQIEESQHFKDFVPPKHDQGGLSQANFQRHHEAHVFRHLQKVAQFLTQEYRARSFDRLILAGPEEPIAELRNLLPRPLAERVVATLQFEITARPSEILERTLDFERQIERRGELDLVRDLFETADGGGGAVYGVSGTLEALWLGEVGALVVADGLHLEGSECVSCGRLQAEQVEVCPACGGEVRPVRDVVERAIERALGQAAAVEIVHDEPGQQLLSRGGGMGAQLRFGLSPRTSTARSAGSS
jgi:peptide chain release factor subunit 1